MKFPSCLERCLHRARPLALVASAALLPSAAWCQPASASEGARTPVPVSVKPVFPKEANTTDSPITVAPLLFDGATTETLSLFLPVLAGDSDDDSVALVEYRESGSATWRQALDLFKHHKTEVAPYAGMIFGLKPDTSYEVRVTVQDPDGVEGQAQQIVTLRTRAIPPYIRAGSDNTVQVSSVEELNNAIKAAKPGQVILLAPGTYSGRTHVLRKYGTSAAPITIRGADGFKSTLSGKGGDYALLIDESDYIHIEGLHISDASTGIRIRNWAKKGKATVGNVVRNNRITNVTQGIVVKSDGAGAPAHKYLYIADNLLEGKNAFGNVASSTWNDEGIVVVAESSEVAYNTISGFGDSLGFSRDQSRAVDIHHNYVVYGGDDGVELDLSDRNVVARENLLTNTGDGLSFQYIISGPAYGYKNLIYNVLPERGPYKIKPEVACNSGVFIFNNTSVNSGRAFINSSTCGSDFFIINNLFTGDKTEKDIIRLDSARFNRLNWSHNAFIYDGAVQFSDLFVRSFSAFKATERGAHDVLILNPVIFRDAELLKKGAAKSLGPQQDPTGKDFHLANGSPAIDAGKVLPGINDGYTGTAPDIGAFESTQPMAAYGVRDNAHAQLADAAVDPEVRAESDPQGATIETAPTPAATPVITEKKIVSSIESVGVGQWAEIDGTKMKSVVPAEYYKDPIRSIVGPRSIMIAWGGGTFDSSRNRLLVWGGGHADYAGNEVYAFDVGELKWHRLTEASNPPANNAETAPDGNPVSRHTYGSLTYLANIDKMLAHGGSRYSDGYGTVTTWLFNLKNNTWEKKVDEPKGAGYGTILVYDKTTGTALQVGGGLTRYDPKSDEWGVLAADSRSTSSGRYGAFDSRRNQILHLGNKQAFLYDVAAGSQQVVKLSGDTGIRDQKAHPGLVYVESADKYYGWNGGSRIYEITPETWNIRVLPVARGSATPTEAPAAGTYGRFQFVPSMNVFVGVNDVDQNVFVYRLGPAPSKEK